MKIKKIILASCDDWQCLYNEDGTLVTQGHSVTVFEVCKFLGVDIEYKEVDDDWASEVGSFPNRLDEIPKEFIK